MTSPTEFFPKLKAGKAALPAVGEFVYVPTYFKPAHLIGGRAKVTEIRQTGRIVELFVEDRPLVAHQWSKIQPLQYELWQSFGGTPPRLPTEEEVVAEAARQEAVKAREVEVTRAIDEYRSTRTVPRTPRVKREFGSNGGLMPTHILKVKAEDGGHGTIGAAWQQDDGSFYITLRPCVVLSWQDSVTIRLFPREDR